MQLVQASDALALAGLSSHQLREWCGRRAVVLPDVLPGGRGRHAMYSWQTILALRLLKELHERFGSEVGIWSEGMKVLQNSLKGVSFPTLWGCSVAFLDRQTITLVEADSELPAGSYLLLQLDPHLRLLASGLALPGPPDQLSLFPALKVGR